MQKNDFEGFRSQKGAALLIMFLALFMVSAAVLLKGLGSRNSSLRQDATTTKALAQAKEALLGYAATSEGVATDATKPPGRLPCPAADNEGGDAGKEDSNLCDSVGLLPWKTLGTGELLDGHGHLLWYARANFTSDTASAQLTLDSQAGVVAVVMAPGPPLSGQNRPPKPLASAATAYLELANPSLPHFVSTGSEDTFNDRVLPVRHDDFDGRLMAAITRLVADELRPHLEANYTGNAYPFAADNNGACENGLDVGLVPNSQGGCTALNTGSLPAWFAADWRAVTNYDRTAGGSAALSFTDCSDVSYTLANGTDFTKNGSKCQ